MLGFVFMIAFTGRDYGPMLTAEKRARTEGKLVADGSTPLASKELTDMEIKQDVPHRIINAILPILTVVVMVIVGLYVNGKGAILSGEDTGLIQLVSQKPFSFAAIREIVGSANAAVAMMWASFAGTIVAGTLVLTQKILTFEETVDAWVDGAKSLIIAIMVLVLAWGIGSICTDLGTADFLIGILEGKIPATIIPLAVFILGSIIAFSTGTSWGTTAILMPIAVPLVYELSGGDTGVILMATIGSVFTGAVFGDHCSPISDTTIMSSMASASDHIDHVKTQMPYALTVALIAAVVGYLPAAVFNMSPIISIILGLGISYLVITKVGKKVKAVVQKEQAKASGE
jgi:Na+/H+ antiporter NhaC